MMKLSNATNKNWYDQNEQELNKVFYDEVQSGKKKFYDLYEIYT